MKKQMSASRALCAVLSAMMVLSGCGGSSAPASGSAAPAAEQAAEKAAPAESQAAGTTAAETTQAETVPVLKVDLNFDLIDVVNNDTDSVAEILGTAETDEKADGSRKMTFNGGKQVVMVYTDSEELNYGRENLVWLLEADASEVFTVSLEPENSAAFMEAMNLDAAPEKTAAEIPGYSFGEGGEVLHFEWQGYDMYAVPDDDGNIGKDSRVVIYMPLEAEEPEPEEEEEEETEKGA